MESKNIDETRCPVCNSSAGCSIDPVNIKAKQEKSFHCSDCKTSWTAISGISNMDIVVITSPSG